MALGDYYTANIESGDRKVVAQVYAVEPVADVAVLGALDSQAAPDEAEAFEEWCNTIEPVRLCTEEFRLFELFPMWIRAHTGRWIEARAQQLGIQASTISARAREGVEGGTSGGPCVTVDGLLLGIVSSSAGPADAPSTEMEISRPHLSVPGSYLRTMLDPEWELRAWRRHIRKHGQPTPRTPFWPEGWGSEGETHG